DRLGWHEQGDGRWFRGIHVPQGRIQDYPEGPRFRSAFRQIAEKLGLPSIVTPNANLLIHDIDESRRAELDSLLDRHRIPRGETFTAARQVAHACVSMPTCGLALAESERVFSDMLDKIDAVLAELGLEEEPLLIRMTGCPNGCARPYNADIAFVGRAPGKYAMFVGGSHRGDRLAGLHTKTVTFDDIPATVRALLADFSKNREAGETFTDFWGRSREIGPEPTPEQFHIEFAERAGHGPLTEI
ncbi:MAG: NADPH-dependent assimilatory sulfite reductase hemoprotein subunit, partial [Verrucomicrobiae bacterium]|nr:NADPH-dependent assimilatory sulfite reductase hemoprotein subunit [Verrucomicrobiae bacterium]